MFFSPPPSSGSFLDLLFEKVELMPSNSLSANLLVTSVISRLVLLPHPLLRSVLVLPEGDAALQPSVRGLLTAISSLRQRLDNIMPTLDGSDEAVVQARRFLQRRVAAPSGDKKTSRSTMKTAEAAVTSVATTISHIGARIFFVDIGFLLV